MAYTFVFDEFCISLEIKRCLSFIMTSTALLVVYINTEEKRKGPKRIKNLHYVTEYIGEHVSMNVNAYNSTYSNCSNGCGAQIRI